ncbi:related to UTP30 - subunit of U3-containing 90S pre-ribosome [Ustilago trichophora]|uniref:Ribosomal L1 domain-containing protein 1 n=1 Tax=Ustilago trichophora TaxID=86804 RepID=A0A5C3E239_9BASI|nr:related to UTP30 - subunit of U3-containing 90S pre-ribosome [Ustilago trichophora]
MPAKTTTKTASPAVAAEKPIIATPSSSQIGVSNSNLDQSQVLKAFKALSAHIARRNNTASSNDSSLPLDGPSGNLRDPSNTVYLQVSINTLSPTSHVKPVRINLPHALHTPGEVSTCLLVKDPQREYKDLLVQHGIKCISRVVGVTKLKGKFKPFEARRSLVQDHDLFLADDRIVPTLPNLCGKVFFDAKKNPITVSINKQNGESLKKELESAIKATTFVQNKGSCHSIKIGYIAKHSAEELTENLMAALPAVLSRVKGGWENVHNIDVKTGNSAALPVWNRKLGVKTHVSASPSALTTSAESTPKKLTASAKRALETEEDNHVETPSKKKASTPKKTAAAIASSSPAIKKVQQADADTPKKPSPRKTRAAAAKVKAGLMDESSISTPVKNASTATPKKIASTVSRSARKTK